MAISRRVCLQRYPTDGRVGDVPSSRSPIYSFNICTASEQTATFTSPAPALSEERGEDAEILLPDCVSVAHLVRRQTEEPQRLHRATNGRMTTLLMNALIIGVGGGCRVGGSREEDGGGCLWVYDSLLVLQPNRRPSPLLSSEPRCTTAETHIFNTCWLIRFFLRRSSTTTTATATTPSPLLLAYVSFCLPTETKLNLEKARTKKRGEAHCTP